MRYFKYPYKVFIFFDFFEKLNSISVSQAPKETPKVRKFESYNADTYKTDEQKKEEVYVHPFFSKHFFPNNSKRKNQGLYNSSQKKKNKALQLNPTNPSKRKQWSTGNKISTDNCHFPKSLMYSLSWKKPQCIPNINLKNLVHLKYRCVQ